MKRQFFLFFLLSLLAWPMIGQQNPGAADVASASFKNIEVSQVKDLSEQPDVILLDVRTPEETAQGKMEGAIELNVRDTVLFNLGIEKLDKEKTYLVYCRSGRRSVLACNAMSKKGFDKLYNLLGGFNAWKEFIKN